MKSNYLLCFYCLLLLVLYHYQELLFEMIRSHLHTSVHRAKGDNAHAPSHGHAVVLSRGRTCYPELWGVKLHVYIHGYMFGLNIFYYKNQLGNRAMGICFSYVGNILVSAVHKIRHMNDIQACWLLNFSENSLYVNTSMDIKYDSPIHSMSDGAVSYFTQITTKYWHWILTMRSGKQRRWLLLTLMSNTLVNVFGSVWSVSVTWGSSQHHANNCHWLLPPADCRWPLPPLPLPPLLPPKATWGFRGVFGGCPNWSYTAESIY